MADADPPILSYATPVKKPPTKVKPWWVLALTLLQLLCAIGLVATPTKVFSSANREGLVLLAIFLLATLPALVAVALAIAYLQRAWRLSVSATWVVLLSAGLCALWILFLAEICLTVFLPWPAGEAH